MSRRRSFRGSVIQPPLPLIVRLPPPRLRMTSLRSAWVCPSHAPRGREVAMDQIRYPYGTSTHLELGGTNLSRS